MNIIDPYSGYGHVLPPDHPIVRVAVEAMRLYAGEDLGRVGAALLLPQWCHVRDLGDREYRSVLLAFSAEHDDIPSGSWLHDNQLSRGRDEVQR